MACVQKESLGVCWRLIYAIFFITWGLIITILNVISLVVLCRRSMRSQKSNHFLTSLVVSDVIMGIGMCPFVAIIFFVSAVSIADHCIVFESMIFGGYCLLYGSSLSSLLAITYDRYLLIHPSTYQTRMTRLKARIIVVLGWGML